MIFHEYPFPDKTRLLKNIELSTTPTFNLKLRMVKTSYRERITDDLSELF